jgi:hypothetical protein
MARLFEATFSSIHQGLPGVSPKTPATRLLRDSFTFVGTRAKEGYLE